jgi:NAD(P)-dependent dehydrogenase (short-subunit alcohol dehydrogenase family)
MDLKGHTALVTGGGQRLGRAFAEALLGRGADVIVHYGKSAEGAQAVVRHAEGLGRRAVALQADLSLPDEAGGLLDRATSHLAPPDLLVNSASVFQNVGFEQTTMEIWQAHLALNLTAPFLLSQAFARQRQGFPGAIANLLDWRALRPGADHFAYTIAKAGLAAMTLSLAQELAPSIRVNGLALGAILPPSGAKAPDPAWIESVPLRRWATLDEATDALLFLLAGPDFLTGTILHLDGGRHLT